MSIEYGKDRVIKVVGYRTWSMIGVGYRTWSMIGVGYRTWSMIGVAYGHGP